MSRPSAGQANPQVQRNPSNLINQSLPRQASSANVSGSGSGRVQSRPNQPHPSAAAAGGSGVGAISQSSRKRKGVLRDGAEPWYLDPPGPDNRLTLALRSGLPSQIDWALSRLIEASYSHSENVIFERLLGLSEALISFPKRLCSALADEPKELWDEKYFELQEVDNAMGIIVNDPNETIRQKRQRLEGYNNAQSRDDSKALNHFRTFGELGDRMASLAPSSRISASISTANITASSLSSSSHENQDNSQPPRNFTFDPSHVPSHARLLRRALEASLILRNCCTIQANSRHLLSQGGMFSLTKSIFDLPDIATGRLNPHSRKAPSATSGDYSALELELESQQYLELEGLTEIRNYFLDMLEGIAPKMHLSKRANFAVDEDGRYTNLPTSSAAIVSGSSTSNLAVPSDSQNGSSSDVPNATSSGGSLVLPKKDRKSNVLRPQDSIFLRLLNFVHHSKDLSLVLGSLRVLAILAASERNEAAFVEMEVDLPVGESGRDTQVKLVSPGLMRRCVELLPVDSDAELQEANLDLLYQLVGIGNNAMRLSPKATSLSSSSSSDSNFNSSNQLGLREKTSSISYSVIRSLVRNLNHSVTKWPREHQMTSHQRTLLHAPDPTSHKTKAEKWLQEARIQVEREGSDLTREEKRRLAALAEPERCEAWLKEILEGPNTGAVAQFALVSSYAATFQNAETRALNAAPLLEGQQVMQAVIRLFPQTRAFQNPNTGQWLLRGVAMRVRKAEPFHCQWPICHSPGTNSYEAVKGHVIAHTSCAADGVCRWSSCNFAVPESETLSLSKVRELLAKHVLSHLPSDLSSMKKETEPKKAEENDGRESRKTGLSTQAKGHLPLVLFDGSRTLPLECDPFLHSSRKSSSRSEATDLETYLKGSSKPNGTGTVDKPGKVSCFVARTPMDSNELPVGIAGTSALILRNLARISGNLLDRSGRRPKPERINKIQLENSMKSHDAQANKKIDYEDNHDPDLFGFPTLPPVEAEDPNSLAFGEEGNQGNSSLGGIPDPWLVEAASILMDAINASEEDLVAVVGCNDVLCKPLNLALGEMRP